MTINENLQIIKRKETSNFDIIYKLRNYEVTPSMSALYDEVGKFYTQAWKERSSLVNPEATIEGIIAKILSADSTSPSPEVEVPEVDPKVKYTNALDNMMKFFTEFQFEPNFRFVNTFALNLAKNQNSAKNYVANYFELIDSPYAKEVREKVKSAEFKSIMSDLKGATPSTPINKRFKLYYGSQGTGKTTIAMEEADKRCMVCNSSMLPSDLMEDFVFVDGKATFKPSALWRCMVEGKPIVLDELNLLPFDSLRFLQTILDGKSEFLYKGNRIEIADGFCVIGTMNLTVNGMTYGLPEPLVDRCAEMRKFSLSASDLLKAICD
jgi:hypothetical protein